VVKNTQKSQKNPTPPQNPKKPSGFWFFPPHKDLVFNESSFAKKRGGECCRSRKNGEGQNLTQGKGAENIEKN